ncbi:MAG: bifunctional phosphopantothenoylcysteine decarboxylase/phosphopantothenate--cysteine ligase CoaBC [Armatimonadetes bacterium]|nr:bifunctional phosphopantothenoylcysteine decarboxylase/phosphopantothenate--cysteine ligase CoaBC [Armatimonadota bacterium]
MNIVLGVSGSVACYRACDFARDLMRAGHEVRVCLTDAGTEFVSPALFEALTGQPCLVGAFEEPERGRMAHIDWARWAHLVVVMPATANVLNKLAAGVGDDMLTTLVLAFEGSIVVAPAMNPSMYNNPATQEALNVLRSRMVEVVEPTEGEVACGEQGQGKLAANDRILAVVDQMVRVRRLYEGKKVLVTSGPTQEPIDDVRFLSNRSSGKMGTAIANAALRMGAEVVLVTGPVSVALPVRAKVVRVRTAEEMLAACSEVIGSVDLVIGAAAVADFRVANPTKGKIRRSEGVPRLDLEPNPDIIAALAKSSKAGARVVAFAAEPGPSLDEARAKMARKGVFAVAVNDVTEPGVGFESDDNQLTLVTADKEIRSPRASKAICAQWLLEALADI